MRSTTTLTLSALLFLGAAAAANAQVTVTAAPVAPAPGLTGNGLNGAYYGQPNVGTNAAAEAFITANSPAATFLSTAVDYPQGDATNAIGNGTLLSTFLGSDAASLSNPAVGANNLGGQLMQFTGFLEVDDTMDINAGLAGIQIGLGIGSDDGSFVDIGTQRILDNGGNHPFGTTLNTFTFSSAGLYALEIVYYEQGGETGVEFYKQTAGDAGFVITPTPMLYTTVITRGVAAPEPGTLALLAGIALPAAWAIRRRRR